MLPIQRVTPAHSCQAGLAGTCAYERPKVRWRQAVLFVALLVIGACSRSKKSVDARATRTLNHDRPAISPQAYVLSAEKNTTGRASDIAHQYQSPGSTAALIRLVERDRRVDAEVLARLDELSDQSRQLLLKHAIENPDEWKSLSSEQQQLDWAVKVFYGTYPDGAPVALAALLSLTNASDTRVAGIAAFVLGVCQVRDAQYESARGTLAWALDRFLRGRTVEEYAAEAHEDDKNVVEKLLKARAVLARKTNATSETDSDVYWSYARVKLWSDRTGECQRWNLLVDYAHALMTAGQRERAVQTLEKALALRRSSLGSVKDRHDDQLRRWKNGASDSVAYDL